MKLVSFLLLFSLADAATISICVQGRESGVDTNLVGASVKCWDEDWDSDDSMTYTGYTGSNGCVNLSYTKKSPKWYNPCTAWDCPFYTNPDIYCRVNMGGFYELYTNTKEDWNQNNVANFGTVTLFPDRVGRGDSGSTNGCGSQDMWQGIADVATYLTGFGDQCNNHDLCYNSCTETQDSCDAEFRDMMYSECNDDWDFSDKSLCKSVADGMYNLVQLFGSDAYDGGQAQYCS